jgi:hypothetical protein
VSDDMRRAAIASVCNRVEVHARRGPAAHQTRRDGW